MSFGDGLTLLGLEITQQQAEAANGVIKQYPIGVHLDVEAFGVYITEDFVTLSTDPQIQLIRNSKFSGTEGVVKTLIVGNSNTSLYKGDGSNALVTAISVDADIDNGQVILASLTGLNVHFSPGDILEFKQSVDANTAGGAYIPFVVVRVAPPDPTHADVWMERDNA